MPFDADAARQAGYNDTEIAGFLAQQNPTFDYAGAKKAGYSDNEIVGGLSSMAPQAKPYHDSSTVWSDLGDIGKDVGKTVAATGATMALHPINTLEGVARPVVQGATRLAGAAYTGLGGDLSPEAAEYLTNGPLRETDTDKLTKMAEDQLIKEKLGMNINYQPTTGTGRAAQTATQTLPFVAEEGPIMAASRAAASGAVGEEARQGAQAAGLGEKGQQVSEVLGQAAGVGIPSLVDNARPRALNGEILPPEEPPAQPPQKQLPPPPAPVQQAMGTLKQLAGPEAMAALPLEESRPGLPAPDNAPNSFVGDDQGNVRPMTQNEAAAAPPAGALAKIAQDGQIWDTQAQRLQQLGYSPQDIVSRIGQRPTPPEPPATPAPTSQAPRLPAPQMAPDNFVAGADGVRRATQNEVTPSGLTQPQEIQARSQQLAAMGYSPNQIAERLGQGTPPAAAPPTPTVEQTPAGAQSVIPGAEQRTPAQMAQRGTNAPMKSQVAQQNPDDGLFDVAGRNQMDLLDQPKPKEPYKVPGQSSRPMSLTTFLKRNGGVQDTGGDISSMGGKDLIRSTGMTQDDAALLAWQHGFLPGAERPTINDLHTAIDESLRGTPRYSEVDRAKVEAQQEAKQTRSVTDPAYVEHYAENLGIDSTGKTTKQLMKEINDKENEIPFDLSSSLSDLWKNEQGSVNLPKIPPEVSKKIADMAETGWNELLMMGKPMAAGSKRAQAIAKDFANDMRAATWDTVQTHKFLTRSFDKASLKNMWEAMDTTSVHMQQLMKSGMSMDDALRDAEYKKVGAFSLPKDQQAVVLKLSAKASDLWQRAKDAGMVKSDGLPFWTPRMAATIGEDGVREAGAMSPKGTGGNLNTRSGSMNQRKYMTAEETEAAMKERFGDKTSMIRDIRAMPLAMMRLEHAVAGREMVNQIKRISDAAGVQAVSDSPHSGFFTMNHPALTTFEPRLVKTGRTDPDMFGHQKDTWDVVKDENGETIFDKKPIYVSKEFEGPLKGVLSQTPGGIYRGLMKMKGEVTGLWLASPFAHNAVLWAKSIPYMPGRVASFRIYSDGAKTLSDPAAMRELIEGGLVPAGDRYFTNDLYEHMALPSVEPGRSLTAQALGWATGKVLGAKAGNALKQMMDNIGDWKSNRMLWEQVGKLQTGIAVNMRDAMMKDGFDRQTATRMATDMANRAAGILPPEAMNHTATKIANLLLFARSFNFTNFATFKDMLTGLPSEVKAQIGRDAGPDVLKAATNTARKKAIATVMLDVGMASIFASLLQNSISYLSNQENMPEIAKGYIRRFGKLMSSIHDHPLNALDPFYLINSLSATSENEPGKENKIDLGARGDNPKQHVYLRTPFGKVGEDFSGWFTDAKRQLYNKSSMYSKPIYEDLVNDKYGGFYGNSPKNRIYQPDDALLLKIGKSVEHLLGNIVQQQTVSAAYDTLTDPKDRELNAAKTLGSLFGATLSKGHPGGPDAAFAKQQKDAARDKKYQNSE